MIINLKKWHYICLGKKRQKIESESKVLGNDEKRYYINRAVRLWLFWIFGITIDHKFIFYSQVKYICKKVAHNLCAILRIPNFSEENQKRMIRTYFTIALKILWFFCFFSSRKAKSKSMESPLGGEFAKLSVLLPSKLSCLRALHSFVPLHLTCLCALPTLILITTWLRTFICDKIPY